MIKKLRQKHYNKQITTRDNGNFQSYDLEESELNSTINANSGAHTPTHDEMIKKSQFNKNNVGATKTINIKIKLNK